MRLPLLLVLAVVAATLHAQTEPASNPNNASASSVKAFRFFLGFDAAASDGCIILRDTEPPTALPQDGTTYEVGDVIDGAKVVHVGSYLPTYVLDGLRANTAYHVRVVAFNGSGGAIDYRQAGPLDAVITTTCKQPEGYYDGIDDASPDFVSDLTALINPHTARDYNDYADLVVHNVVERDTPVGRGAVVCDYTGEVATYFPPISFSSSFYTREHMMPRSWMPTGGNTDIPSGSDYHNLAVTNHPEANEVRLNHPFGEVVNTVEAYLEGKAGFDSFGNYVYEPRDAFKGDAARAVLYMMICYDGTNGNWGLQDLASRGGDQLQSVLKAWHAQDPPSLAEIARHEYVAFVQGNRNPFIDHPEWVDCINFFNLSKTATCVTEEVDCETVTGLIDRGVSRLDGLRLWPNPSNGRVEATWTDPLTTPGAWTLTDATGRVVRSGALPASATDLTLDIDPLAPGIYHLGVRAADRRSVRAVIRR